MLEKTMNIQLEKNDDRVNKFIELSSNLLELINCK